MLECHIKYKDLEHMIKLPDSAPLGLLKGHIHLYFDIVPSKQLIFGLGDVNKDTLIKDVGTNLKILVLTVDDDVRDYVDLIAAYNFYNIYPHIQQTLMGVKDLLQTTKDKPIMLYLYDGKRTEFLKDVLHNINLFQWKRCELVIWNVLDDTYHDALQDKLNDIIENSDDFDRKIVRIDKRSCLFILIPMSVNPFYSLIENDQIVYSNVNFQIDIARSIIENNLIKFNYLENAANAYQQYMASNFGDRDYDSFEADEHNYLKYKIAFAFYGPPNEDQHESSDFENFNFDANIRVYDEKQVKFVEEAYEKILKHNNMFTEHPNVVVMRVIYNVTEVLPKNRGDNDASLISAYPVFVIRKCKNSDSPCCTYVDHQLRVYKSFIHYIKNVKLPRCVMVLPRNGKYTLQNDLVNLNRYYSPSCNLGSQILEASDIGTSIFGIASGGVTLAATMLAVPPVGVAAAVGVAIVTGIYGIGRGIHSLIDKSIHDEDMSFKNSDARSAYLNLLTGALSFGSMAAVRGLMVMTARGARIPQVVQQVANAVNVACITSSFIAVGVNAFDIIADYINNDRKPSTLAIVQLSTSLLFFGHSVYSFRTANTIINETQANSLNQVSSTLSNKQRKMLNKLVKETTRVNTNAQHAKADIIKTIRTTNGLSDTLKFLSKHNTMFNKNEVRFAMIDGKINLNGVPIETNVFNGMNNVQIDVYLSQLPSIPASSEVLIRNDNMTNYIKCFQTVADIALPSIRNSSSIAQIIAHLFNRFSAVVQEKLSDIIYNVLREILQIDASFLKTLKTTFPDIDASVQFVKMILNFFQNVAQRYVEDYERKKEEAAREPNFNETEFDSGYFVHPINADAILRYIEKAVIIYDMGLEAIKMLIRYIYSCIARQVMDFVEERVRTENRTPSSRSIVTCTICNGRHYT